MSFECSICHKTFKSKKYLHNHIYKNAVPCDFKCNNCGIKLGSKTTFLRHKKKCTEDLSAKVVNNVTTNNVNANRNKNTNNNTINTNNNINQNVLLLQPFEVERQYMHKKVVISPIKDVVIGLLREQKYAQAYEALFNQIHGNEKYPEYHNIYLPDINRDEVAIFKGRNFKLDAYENRGPGLFDFLKCEMKKLVNSCAYMDKTEKDQIIHDIWCNWQSVNDQDNPNMKRTLYNNRNVVFGTFNKFTVKPHTNMILSEFVHNNLPVPTDINREHIVKLA